MTVDLHAHTTASDGSLTPTELVTLARQSGLQAVAVTDHDTVFGWDEAFTAAARANVEVVPGVELSTSYDGGRFHLLAYYIHPVSPLLETIERIQLARTNRNDEIFGNLAELGVPLTEEEVWTFAAEGGQLGRPHFARAMMARGYVESVQEAFDKFLADGKPAYATKAVLSPQDAIRQIHDAGGVAVWAHPPLNRNFTLDDLTEKLPEWVSWGLDGLETYYSRYTPEETAWAEKMVQQYGLIGSGGSDFHGVSKPDITLGIAQDGRTVPSAVLAALKQRRDEIRAGGGQRESGGQR